MIGHNLKKYREDKALSQSDVAGKLFVTRQCVSKWEKGVTQPDVEMLKKLSILYGVSIDALVADNYEQPEPIPEKKDKNLTGLIINAAVAVFCLTAFIIIWRFLPATIPAHWSSGGVIDRYGSRNETFLHLITVAMFALTDLGLFFVLKRAAVFSGMKGYKASVYVCHGTIVALQFINLLIILLIYDKYLTDVICLSVCFSANFIMCFSLFMHPKVNGRNLILGVRTEDTLNSEKVWSKTNALASYVFMAVSLLIVIFGMVFASKLWVISLVAYVPATAAFIIYAKMLIRKERRADKE